MKYLLQTSAALASLLILLIPAVVAQTDPQESAAANITAELVVSGLDRPVFVASAPGDTKRLFIVEQVGRVQVIADGELQATPFLDISDRLLSDGERGLLSIAFDPDYRTNRRFYVNYTDKQGRTVVSRFLRKRKKADSALPKSEKIVLRIGQPLSNHNGGQLQFGPDGYLYIGMGDGGGAGDPLDNAQNLRTRLGSLLRIDVKELPYTIPSTNPFVNAVVTGVVAHPETWAYGLRNPWRFSFDLKTGDLYIGDVGQASIEEINFQPASSSGGQNYGWDIMEGSMDYDVDGRSKNGLVPPIHEYNHSTAGTSSAISVAAASGRSSSPEARRRS